MYIFILGIEFTMPLCQNKDSDSADEFDEYSQDWGKKDANENRLYFFGFFFLVIYL